jgi:putative NIF3 family GTP cyclohydrolase 1 type 2
MSKTKDYRPCSRLRFMTSHLRNSLSQQFISDVICTMEHIAPLKLADNTWDNVGLLAESPLPLNERLILVANDLSSKVVAEAVSKKASMIIAYHPPWFKAAKNIRLNGPLSNINYCISNGISVFSPHTALDSISGGSIKNTFIIYDL